MCRWMAWLGQPVLVEELLFNTQHGIVDQSLHSRMGAETTNGDGFGLGWYGAGDGPGLYHSVAPAWADANLRELAGHVESPLFLAHVRAAIGSPVQQTNCHPFRHGNWLFVHNGYVATCTCSGATSCSRSTRSASPTSAARPTPRSSSSSRSRSGSRRTRSARWSGPSASSRRPAARHGVVRRSSRAPSASRTARRLWAVRYATEGTARTLFASADVDAIHRLYPDNARLQPPRRGRPADRLRAVRRPAGRLAGDRRSRAR